MGKHCPIGPIWGKDCTASRGKCEKCEKKCKGIEKQGKFFLCQVLCLALWCFGVVVFWGVCLCLYTLKVDNPARQCNIETRAQLARQCCILVTLWQICNGQSWQAEGGSVCDRHPRAHGASFMYVNRLFYTHNENNQRPNQPNHRDAPRRA